MTDGGEVFRFKGVGGLDLAARQWRADRPDAPIVLCLHGLTRNSRDFTAMAQGLGRRYRLIAPDQRGRGLSTFADPASYQLPVQVQDTFALLDHLKIGRCVIVGTSMGALMAVTMAAMAPDRIAGVVLNDAGPVIDPTGLARIAAYVGQADSPETWVAAVRRLQAIHGQAFPNYTDAQWERFARWTYVWGEAGLRPDYDPRLREALAATAGSLPDLWPVFEVLKTVPGLLIRGAVSDLLAADTAAAVRDRLGARLVTVPDRGHAPDLSEPESLLSILAFLNDPAVQQRLQANRAAAAASTSA